MVVNQLGITRSWRATTLLLGVWLPGAGAGWAVHAALAGASDQGAAGAIGWWLASAAVAVGVGVLLTRALPAQVKSDPAVCWAVFVGVGWGIAMAAGWFFDVAVGGPAFGLVIALAVAAAGTGAPMSRVGVVAGCGLVGLLAGWWVVTARPPVVVVLVVTTTCGLLAAAAAARLLVPSMQLRPVVGLTCASAVAWVGAYELMSPLASRTSLAAAVCSEIVIAVAVGAAALGWATRAASAEPVWEVVRRWTLACLVGLAASLVVALLLRAVAMEAAAAGVFAHLDAGTTVGLAAAAAFAVLPTLRRLRQAAGTDPAVAP